VFEQISVLRRLGGSIAAVNVTDNAAAMVRMSSLAVCKILLDAGFEPVFQVTCRDRNRIAIQADLIAACAFGVKNVFCVTGDYVSFGDDPEAKPVYDLDSIQLLHVFNRIRETGKLSSGTELRQTPSAELVRPSFFLGAAENPFSDPVELRVRRLAKKHLAGAQFIQTQCVFDIARMQRFMQLVREEGLDKKLYILAGVMPVKSHRPLEFIRDRIPGMKIPEVVIRRMKSAKDAAREGIAIAVETIAMLREIPGLAGIHLMTVHWQEAIEPVLSSASLIGPTMPRRA